MKLDVLAIAAHPDDVEANAGGTVLRLIAAGKKVGLIDLTKGELGTRGNAQIRTQEAFLAAKMLQATLREQLDLPDGFFAIDYPSIQKVAAKIREYQPDLILTNSPDDRHPDHIRAADLVVQATIKAAHPGFYTAATDGSSQTAWSTPSIYHFLQDRSYKIDTIVDISLYIEEKIAALKAYQSQFYDPKNTEPETMISSAGFFGELRAQNAFFGRLSGVAYAEAFSVNRRMGMHSFFDFV